MSTSTISGLSHAERIDSPVFVLRRARGWSIEELAARSGISPRTVYNIETARTMPHRATRHVLAVVLGCDPDDLVRPQNDLELAANELEEKGGLRAGAEAYART